MNKRFVPSVIALLSSCDFTLSFIPPVGKVNAATFSSGKKTTSRLFFYGDYDDDNYFQGGGFNGDGYLHQVSNLRGGSNINDNKDTLSSLSVSELKRLLNDRGVDPRLHRKARLGGKVDACQSRVGTFIILFFQWWECRSRSITGRKSSGEYLHELFAIRCVYTDHFATANY